jgi:hypothetical protein
MGSYASLVIRDRKVTRLVREQAPLVVAATRSPAPERASNPLLESLGQPFARPANAEDAARFIADNPDLVNQILNPKEEK